MAARTGTAADGGLRIAILMMQKNESVLLPLFLAYHEALFGSASLYIFDNGSTDPRVIRTLRAAERRGVRVNWEHRTAQDFVNKGEILTRLIKELDHSSPCDFYFPLDCDEFLAALESSGPSCSRRAIEQVLLPFRGRANTLCISHKYSANPLLSNRYQITTQSRKCFFACHSCDYLDHGYHHGRCRSGEADVTVPIVYFEFHFRPYALSRRASHSKVKAFHGFMLRRNLNDYISKRVPNHHSAITLLQSKLEYLSQFTPDAFPVVETALLAVFARLGVDHRGLLEPQPPFGRRCWLRWLAVRALLVDRFTGIHEGVQELILALPYLYRSLRRRIRGD